MATTADTDDHDPTEQAESFWLKEAQLSVFEDGRRAIRGELVPVDFVAELADWMQGKRAFWGDPESWNASGLVERLAESTYEFVGKSTSIVDDLPSIQGNSGHRQECGRAFGGGLMISVTRRVMDEILRQNLAGRPITQLELGIRGLEPTTSANSEGGQIQYIFRRSATGLGCGSELTIHGVQIHFDLKGYNPEPSKLATEPPTLPTADDVRALHPLLGLRSDIKRIKWFVAVSCVLLLFLFLTFLTLKVALAE